jgi:hypothetical protein
MAGPVLWAAARARVMLWDRTARSPRALHQAQQEALLSNCRAAADSAFGRAHDLARVRDHADLRARVPLRPYEDFLPYLRRLRGGERGVLLPGLIPYLARSAGTSQVGAKLKYLPVSRRQIAWQRKQAFDIVARYLVLSGDLGFPGGFTLGLLQPPKIEWEGEVGLTSNPRLMQLHVPKVSRRVSLPRPPVRDIEDYDAKFRAIAEAYMDHDVRAIAGTTCWFTVLFEHVLAAARARGRDVSTIHEIWPNLRGLLGGGVHAPTYRPIIGTMVGGRTTLIDTYNATEGGCFAVTDSLEAGAPGGGGDDAMLVLPDRGVFYEFIRRSEHGRLDATRVPLSEVEPGVDYSVAVSTASGLFGYLLGDVVRFVSVFPHRLVFSGRVNGEISIAHEMTTARQIEDAVLAATKRHGCTLVELAASSELAERAVGRYLVFAEFERPPADLAAFERDLDAALCEENRLYRKHRTREVGILPLRVVSLERGATQRFAEAAGRRGLQQKFPRVLQRTERDLLLRFASPIGDAQP